MVKNWDFGANYWGDGVKYWGDVFPPPIPRDLQPCAYYRGLTVENFQRQTRVKHTLCETKISLNYTF